MSSARIDSSRLSSLIPATTDAGDFPRYATNSSNWHGKILRAIRRRSKRCRICNHPDAAALAAKARSPRRLLLKRPYADVGGAGSDRLALQPLPKLHPAVKRSPEVTDLSPGAGRGGPGHGYGARPGRILGRRWQLLSRRVGQLLYYPRAYS